MPQRETSEQPGAFSGANRVVLRKGQVVTITINSLAHGGEGVSKDMGLPIFVNRAVKGDQLEVTLFDVRKDFARGEIVSIISPGPGRTEPPCKLFKVCGGCQWQHITYEEQLDSKADIVRQAMKHIGKLDPDLVQPTIGAQSPLFYRNKVQFPVRSVPGTGRIMAGYYAQNSHDLVNIKHCPVQPEPLDRALEVAKYELQDHGVTVYDEKTHTGLLRHINQRYSFAFNKVLITLVLNCQAEMSHDLAQRLDDFAEVLMAEVPEVSGVCVNFNSSRGNRILGDTTICLAGEPFITERLRSHLPNAPEQLKEGILFRLSSTSFFQVNTAQAEILLDQVLLAATSTGPDGQSELDKKVPLLMDCYAGVGTMASWLSSVADRIVAVEEMAPSVIDGMINLNINKITNVDFVESRVEVEVSRMLDQAERADVVVVDPPRKGIDPVGLEALVKLGADRIVYVSCNPATLARDLRYLSNNGYTIKRVQPIDMFPQTFHVECVTILERARS